MKYMCTPSEVIQVDYHVMIAGPGGIGKTKAIMDLLGKPYENQKPTIGSVAFYYSVDNKKILLIDTSGQHLYEDLLIDASKNSNGVVLFGKESDLGYDYFKKLIIKENPSIKVYDYNGDLKESITNLITKIDTNC